MNTEEKAKRLLELAEEVTGGEWEDDHNPTYRAHYIATRFEVIAVCGTHQRTPKENDHNASFITFSRNNAPEIAQAYLSKAYLANAIEAHADRLFYELTALKRENEQVRNAGREMWELLEEACLSGLHESRLEELEHRALFNAECTEKEGE